MIRAALVIVALAACGGGKAEPDKLGGACDSRAQDTMCSEFLPPTSSTWVKDFCAQKGMTFLPACPKQGAVAKCTNPNLAPEFHTYFYGSMTRDMLATLCRAPQQVLDP